MKVDLVGKIKNTQLPRSKALLPMFEAVVNSFQSIEDAGGRIQNPIIEIIAKRDPVLPGIEMDTEVNGFVITDNGVGFNDANVDSFFTSDTQYKVGRGGKGIGRFMWLKAFDHAEIESHYPVDGKLVKMAFDFTLAGDQPPDPPEESKETTARTTVRLIEMKYPYKEDCPRGLVGIGHRLIQHCLPFFLDPKCPVVIISDEKDRIDLNHYFRENFAAKATQHSFKIGDSTFSVRGLRLYNPHETQHRLIYAANSREVFPEKLEKYLPNLQRKLADREGL